MAINLRLERLLQDVRRWRGLPLQEPLAVSPSLSDSDTKRLADLLNKTISGQGGEPAARRRAKTIALTYASLDSQGRQRFLQYLAEGYGPDDDMVDAAIVEVQQAANRQSRRIAETRLAQALQGPRQTLLQRLAGIRGGLPFMIELREDLLPIRHDSPALSELDGELRSRLASWFDVGFLDLKQLTWDTPASFLEKLIAYEAVHAISSWDDLRRRLGPGRRCYAFVHPVMADEPLIFVEVALTQGMADSVMPFVTRVADYAVADGALEPMGSQESMGPQESWLATEETDADTAIFYSISNCHRGLAGVSLGDFLIKSVVEAISAELGNIGNFATLSPLPSFRGWLLDRLASKDPVLTGDEALVLSPSDSSRAQELFTRLIAGPMPEVNDPTLIAAREPLTRLAADYVVNERRADGRRALDAVTHFHLSNGARAERLNWLANPTQTGWERGLAMMINYRYQLRWIERNHDRYSEDGVVAASAELTRLARWKQQAT